MLEDFAESERVKAANSPVEPESDEEMPDLGTGQSATVEDEADFDVDDDKPDDTAVSNETEFQGMKIEVRSGTEVPKWLKLYEWGVESLTAEGATCMDNFPTAPEIMDLIWGKWIAAKNTKALAIFIRGDKDALTASFEQGVWTKRVELDEPVPYTDLTTKDSRVNQQKNNTGNTATTST